VSCGADPGSAAVAKAALLTERSDLQHCPGHVGGDVLCVPDFGERLEGAVDPTAGPAEQALIHLNGGHLRPSLGCELPEKAPLPLLCAACENHAFARCGGPHELCWSLTAGFLSAADLQRFGR